jgi:hypothetical protein
MLQMIHSRLVAAFTPSPHFVALLVLDATTIEDAAIRQLAKNLLSSGCVFFISWGPDCERVHDLFDTVANFYEPLIMTTWESDEPLDEAIWELLYMTHPHDAYWDTCRNAVAITVGNSDWSAQVERRLKDIESLTVMSFPRSNHAMQPTALRRYVFDVYVS